MKVEGVKEFDASPQTVWDVLMDPTRISKLLPGVENFEVQDDKHWSANVKVPLGTPAPGARTPTVAVKVTA